MMLLYKNILNKWLSLTDDLSYNITFHFLIHKCQDQQQDNSDQIQKNDVYEDEPKFQPRDSVWTRVFRGLRFFYGFGRIQTNDSETNDLLENVTPSCESLIDSTIQKNIQAASLMNYSVIIALSVIFGLLGICAFRIIYKKFSSKALGVQIPAKKRTHIRRGSYTIVKKEQTNLEQVNDSVPEVKVPVPKEKCPIQLIVFSSSSSKSRMLSKKTDTESFLHCTIDKFLVELDKTLGIGSNGMTRCEPTPSLNENRSATSLQSPRLLRRSSWRRPKQQTPSLPFDAFNFATDGAAARDAALAWHELETTQEQHQWQFGTVEDFDLTNTSLDSMLKEVLQFYQTNCPVKLEQWSAASLMVSYVLMLLEKEFQQIQSPVTVLQMKGIGSMSKGLRFGKANQFDCLMVLKANSCHALNVFHHSVTTEIPPGRVVLGVQKESVQYKVCEKNPLMKRVLVGDDMTVSLLPYEVLAAAHTLVEKALNNLGTKHKTVMDRLPFTLHKPQSSELSLSLDTRILHGLGLGITEVNIRLVPAVPLLCHESSFLPAVYAVPPWNIQELKTSSTKQSRIFRNSTLASECFWHLCCSDLESAYLNTMDQRFELSGVDGCHKICLHVLKALFSNSFKSSLLSRGEVKSFHLESVLFFLLLESNPHHWTIEKLPDRISDSIHFLRSALQSMWLPSFFIHNPHLEKQMPALKILAVLHGGRQENLFAELNNELAEKMTNFIKDRLNETGLQSCVKEDVSMEMWEYEFFMFG